ncbi:Metallophosphoesterase domain-containing protein 1 [Trichoplax sp. H2]|nr:Metallophosphoesterase domain-containing protein 1 [Trichoplax sp. H2]|eukprot:RDD44704.1 Metallophosphoesterase domain-containing protein 1 [Trichoplax sp. H2]
MRRMIKSHIHKKEASKSVVSLQHHPLARAPDLAWKEIFLTNHSIANAITLETPIVKAENDIRIVCISDTHSLQSRLPDKFIPDGDILIHAGDFTMYGNVDEVIRFNSFVGELPHAYKVAVAGNHEICLDETFDYGRHASTAQWCKSLLTNCIYLEDSFIELYNYKIYGSPWQPRFSDMGFNLERGQECFSKWKLIPTDTDILITHGPPLGHGDYCKTRVRAGCVDLLHIVEKEVKPLYHIFGHIHEGYGVTTNDTTKFINASTCTQHYKPTNKPIVFDLPKRVVKVD